MSKKRKGVKDADAKRIAMAKKRGEWVETQCPAVSEIEVSEDKVDYDTFLKLLDAERRANVGGEDEFVWKEGFNYHPAHPGIWVPYNGWRVKFQHDIRLRDGRVIENCYPNATAWHGKEGRFTDEEVVEIRLCPPEEQLFADLDYLVSHSLESFGEQCFPEIIISEGGVISFKPKRYRYFEKGIIDERGDVAYALWEGTLTAVEAAASKVYKNLSEQSEPLGEEFSKVLDTNINDLYLE